MTMPVTWPALPGTAITIDSQITIPAPFAICGALSHGASGGVPWHKASRLQFSRKHALRQAYLRFPCQHGVGRLLS
jgi:hypothetical protein